MKKFCESVGIDSTVRSGGIVKAAPGENIAQSFESTIDEKYELNKKIQNIFQKVISTNVDYSNLLPYLIVTVTSPIYDVIVITRYQNFKVTNYCFI